MTEQQQPPVKKRGRPAKNDRAMSNAQRQAQHRAKAKGAEQQADFEKERAQKAREHLREASSMLLKYWEKNNGNRDPKVVAAFELAGKSLKHISAARMLLSPVWHLYVTERKVVGNSIPDFDKPVEPRRLICGSTDFEHATDAMGFYYMGQPENMCPECSRRKREFYKGW